MLILGFDPGNDGGVALLDSNATRVITGFPLPTLTLTKGKGTKREISFALLIQQLDDTLGVEPVGHVFVEQVQSSPQMGVTSAFNFGRGFGGLQGIITARHWPVEYVTPNKWKRTLAVPANKEDAVQRACHLMPNGVPFWTPERGKLTKEQACGVAEAALVGYYGCQWLREHGLITETKPPRKRVILETIK